MRHFLTLNDLSNEELNDVIDLAYDIKKNPENYADAFPQKTLLMIFQKPSLRTRVSFETGTTKMGGHAIYYNTATSPMGKGETIHDTAKCASRYVDMISARLFDHKDIEELAAHSDVPVINMLTNFSHPCQILADLLSIKEKKGKLKGLKLAFIGDGDNNVTHSLMFGCAKAGISMSVGSPEEHWPNEAVVKKAKKIGENTGSDIVVTMDAKVAVFGADVVVTDTWMSYHIKEDERAERVKKFMPYQVNADLMSKAKKDAIFMHCLPAYRGSEVTAEVIDGPQSIVFDEAENRIWTEMAVMLFLQEALLEEE